VTDHSESNGFAELTVKIVSAYVSNNTIAQSELAELITTVASRLGQGSADPEQLAEERPEPAVSVRRSIRPDHLVCLVCGQPQKMLKRHLATRHDLTAAPNYAQQRREFALQTGLGRPKKPARRGRKPSGPPQQAEPSTAVTA